ncbi:MAG: ABC transporter substrate-binding protein [Treponema sp.]|jgi:polar amino acid transport system substrate-binding protein|nr:ABC transporter substrate-binding protein [Treponema sp.]
MKLKTGVVAVLFALVLTGVLFAGGGKQKPGGLTIKPGVLMVGMEIGYPPMEYLDADGKPVGFDVELAGLIAKKMGLEVELVDTAWDGIFAGVDTGKYDCIISSVTITEARLGAHTFSKPYIGNAMSMVLLKGSNVRAKNPEELGGLGVAYQAETTADFYMADLAAGGLKFTPYEYDKVINCFDELKLGRVDAIVTDSLVAVDYIAPADTPFELVWQGPADEKFGICLKKGNDALAAEINKALDQLFAEGTMHSLSQKIFKIDMVSAALK